MFVHTRLVRTPSHLGILPKVSYLLVVCRQIHNISLEEEFFLSRYIFPHTSRPAGWTPLGSESIYVKETRVDRIYREVSELCRIFVVLCSSSTLLVDLVATPYLDW